AAYSLSLHAALPICGADEGGCHLRCTGRRDTLVSAFLHDSGGARPRTGDSADEGRRSHQVTLNEAGLFQIRLRYPTFRLALCKTSSILQSTGIGLPQAPRSGGIGPARFCITPNGLDPNSSPGIRVFFWQAAPAYQ